MLRSILLLQVSQVTGRLLFFIFSFWYLNAYLGVAAKGTWTAAFSLFGILAVFSNMGFEIWLSRAAARENVSRGAAIGFLFRIKSSLWLLCLLVGAWQAARQDLPVPLAIAFGVALILDGIGVAQQAVFEGKKNVRWLAGLTFLKSGGFSLAALLLAAFWHQPTLSQFAILFAVMAGCRALVGWRAWSLLPAKTDSDGDSAISREAWVSFLTLGAYTFVTVLYFQIDAVMLYTMTDQITTGHYGNAYNLVEGALFLSAAVSAVLYPRLVQALAEDRARMFDQASRFVLLLGGAAVIGFWFVGEPLGYAVLGDDFTGGASLLRLLALAVPFMYANGLTSRLLFAEGREGFALLTASALAGFNIIGNALLIPRMGGEGAALMTVLTEGLLFVVWSLFGRRSWSSVWLALAIAAVLGAVAALQQHMSGWFWPLTTGVVVLGIPLLISVGPLRKEV